MCLLLSLEILRRIEKWITGKYATYIFCIFFFAIFSVSHGKNHNVFFFLSYFWLFLKEESGGEWSGAKLADAAGTARPISQ